ncbi:PREDICTED: LOW QUALITY PROTEIN: calsyntenin-1-like [Acropora digitifera]|uniref:LOW QUALITY PROTEIN: calsyntenin-1-like n=1 Tax=Acropora digitifera TaxID=70779 RepID=UPI00077A9A19|nr:PREDICTED: LOW QUALITY PROTEIN: calsyntenin-1-like [Acropora digitifera]
MWLKLMLLICNPTEAGLISQNFIFLSLGFEFTQPEYARTITEYHAVNKTVMHIRAVGCHRQPVQYTITQPDTPFTIDEKGHIILLHPLNSDEAKSYDLNVRATSGNGKCVAHTKVLFVILNKNKHAPEFEFESYSCKIVENTLELQINPPLRVLDEDHGDAGKVRNVTIVESGLPFVFTVADDGTVHGKATTDMDAEDVTDYFFDIIATDNGHIGVGNGRVCKYIVEGFNLPFTVSEKGVVSLDFPLDKGSYDSYEFNVDAVDCGGMMSLTSAKVSIAVKTQCHKEFIRRADQELVLQQCSGKVNVAPSITLNECAKKLGNAHFSAAVSLDTKAGMGCDRETFEASDTFTICGADDFIDLLPKPGTGREWTKMLKKTQESLGKEKNGFYLDGQTYVEIPEGVVPEDIGDKFTISLWIKMEGSKSRQTILANTDKERLDRVHFSLTTSGSKLLFVHRREAIHAGRDVYCNAEFQYNVPELFDLQWHHIAAVVDGCSAKVYIDGEHHLPAVSIPDWTLHKSNIKNKFSIGARYLAKEKAFMEYFKGYLSGVVIKPNSVLSEMVLQCVTRCREHVNVEGPLPGNFSAKTVNFNAIEVSGEGTPEEFIKVLQNVIYINERLMPTPGIRSVNISAKVNDEKLEDVTINLSVAGNTRPVIVVKGLDSDIDVKWDKRKLIKERGVHVFDSLEIEYYGCESDEETPIDKVRYLDAALVTVDPPFKKGESFIFRQGIEALKKQKGLSVSFNRKEMIIRGVGHFSEYEDVLRQVVYVNSNPDNTMDKRFTVAVSTLNGRCLSDVELRHLSVIHANRDMEKYNIKAAKSSLEQEALPGYVSLEGSFESESSDGGSLSSGIMAVIVVCSLLVFIVLVVIGVYKYRQRPTTVKVVSPGDEKEEMYWDDTGLSGVRITLNPMQKFQELDLNEDGAHTDNQDTEDEEGGAAKGLLEWDNSDI